MTNSVQEAWLAAAPGRAMNPDNAYGLQCVDVADDYAMALFPGKGWAQTIGATNGANGLAGRDNDYFDWYPNIPGDLTSVPARGDLVIFGGSGANPYGHVAVVLSADAYKMVVIQQDGYLQTVAHIATLPYDGPGTGPCTGWLRPNVAPDTLEVLANEREVGAHGVRERKSAAVRDDNLTGRLFKAGDVLTFKGFERGQSVNGSDVWFIGAFSGGRFHSSAFNDGSTTGLTNLTPVAAPSKPPALTATQRFAGANGVNLRTAPSPNGTVAGTFKPGDVLNFKGFVRGDRPFGASSSDVWLVGISGNFVWAGAVVRGDDLTGLPEIKLGVDAPAPAPVEKYSFAKRFDCVTKVVPAALANFQRGNFPARPEYLVVHQMDSVENRPTLAGTASWFQTPRPDKPSTAHFGAEENELFAFVDTVDRAYHAGAVGNNYLSVEVPPNPSAATIETVKRFQREYRAKNGYALKLTDHRAVPGNSTECGKNIPLSRFAIEEPTPAPAPAPAPAPVPVQSADAAVRDFLDSLFNAWKAGRK